MSLTLTIASGVGQVKNFNGGKEGEILSRITSMLLLMTRLHCAQSRDLYFRK